MTRRSLRFEQLERRELLAGDVKMALVRGDLIVTGDSNKTAGVDEAIEISYQAEDSTYRVTGVNGTRVDGLESKFVSGVTRNIVVDLKTGTDSVSIWSTTAFPVPGDLTVKGGSGVDFISVKNANIVGKLNIDGGSDANTVVVQSSIVGKDASIKGLAGVDTVTVGTEGKVTIKGRLIVDTGAGNDTITVNGVDQDVVIARQYKDVAVKTGDGDDILTITNSTLLGKLNIDSGKGNDDVTVDPTSISKDVSISTGDGTDGVWLKDGTIGNSTLGAKLTVNTGNGNDRVGVVDTWVGSSISISTGNDNDEIGLVRVTTPLDISVSDGNGHNSKDSQIGVRGDRVGLAGVTAKNVTLDGGDASTALTSGVAGIGVTGSKIHGNLTIKTGSATDRVGVGDDSASDEQSEDGDLIASLRGLLVDPDDNPIDLDRTRSERSSWTVSSASTPASTAVLASLRTTGCLSAKVRRWCSAWTRAPATMRP